MIPKRCTINTGIILVIPIMNSDLTRAYFVSRNISTNARQPVLRITILFWVSKGETWKKNVIVCFFMGGNIVSFYLFILFCTIEICIYNKYHSLREKCPNTKLFLVRIFLYLDWIWRFLLKIRTRNNSVFGYFSRSDYNQQIAIFVSRRKVSSLLI